MASANPTAININVDCISERNHFVRTTERAQRISSITGNYRGLDPHGALRNYAGCMNNKVAELLATSRVNITGENYWHAYSHYTYHTSIVGQTASIAMSWDHRAVDANNWLNKHRIIQYDQTW